MSNQAGDAALASAAEALREAPTVDEAKPGDKSTLGKVQSALEGALERLPEEQADARALLERLIDLSFNTILDDVNDPAGCEALLFRAAEDLAAAFENPSALPDVVRALSEVHARLTAAPEADGGAEADVAEDEGPPPPDPLTINGEEDEVIYVEFIAESNEHLENIEARVLELESSADDVDLINDMFRCFHSMKGAAGFLGLSSINSLCHEVETLLDRARKMTLQVDRVVVDTLLASIDVAKQLLGRLHLQIEKAGGRLDESVEMPVVDTRPVIGVVKQILARPPSAPGDPGTVETKRLGDMLVEDGAVSEEDLASALQQQKRPVGEILVQMGAVSENQVAKALAKQGAATASTPKATAIKVDTERLDRLMEMVGELVIAESQVHQDPSLQAEENLGLARNVGELDKIVRNLQELVMAMRLVPLKQTFQKMFRLVRDTARKTNKSVRLEIAGEDTEIDKTVIEEIADPLVHLLRNAVDHGVEAPDDRVAAGKEKEGVVRLTAYHEGGNVVIEIGDDGKGLDPDRLLAKAIEKGVYPEGANPSREEILNVIFTAGFSTHAVATDISGRGVGMDVVKRNIEHLGGRVEIESEVGRGTTFFVRLPLTMAIVDGMIVEVCGDRYVLPTLGIEESMRPSAEQLSTVAGRGRMVMVRGDLLPLVDLAGLFDGGKGASGRTDASDSLVIIVSNEGRRCGLVVDELLGQQQVVIKNLGTHLQGVRGVSGGCILGDGRVGLILDVAGLIRLSETN